MFLSIRDAKENSIRYQHAVWEAAFFVCEFWVTNRALFCVLSQFDIYTQTNLLFKGFFNIKWEILKPDISWLMWSVKKMPSKAAHLVLRHSCCCVLLCRSCCPVSFVQFFFTLYDKQSDQVASCYDQHPVNMGRESVCGGVFVCVCVCQWPSEGSRRNQCHLHIYI